MVLPWSILNINEAYIEKKKRQIFMHYFNTLYKILLQTKNQEWLLQQIVTWFITNNITLKRLLKIIAWCIPSVISCLAVFLCLILLQKNAPLLCEIKQIELISELHIFMKIQRNTRSRLCLTIVFNDVEYTQDFEWLNSFAGIHAMYWWNTVTSSRQFLI